MISTVIRTSPVMVAPNPLIDWLRRIRRRSGGDGPPASSCCQCFTIPIWDSVNDTNTPTV